MSHQYLDRPSSEAIFTPSLRVGCQLNLSIHVTWGLPPTCFYGILMGGAPGSLVGPLVTTRWRRLRDLRCHAPAAIVLRVLLSPVRQDGTPARTLTRAFVLPGGHSDTELLFFLLSCKAFMPLGLLG